MTARHESFIDIRVHFDLQVLLRLDFVISLLYDALNPLIEGLSYNGVDDICNVAAW